MSKSLVVRRADMAVNPSFPTVREKPRTYSKPLPPLPVENYVSVMDTKKQRGHIFRTPSAALLLPLDTRSVEHARVIMRRSFEQLQLPRHPWEKVVSDILNSITSQYPHVIGLVDSPFLQKMRQGDSTTDNEKNTNDDHMAQKKAVYCITVEMTCPGQPSASGFYPDQFSGRPLLQLPSNYSNELENGHSSFQFVGGTASLHGDNLAVLRDVAQVLGIMMFTLYNLTLDACVLRDHRITRPGSNKRKPSISPNISDSKTAPKPSKTNEEKTNSSGLTGLLGWMRPNNTKSKKNSVRKLIERFSGDKPKGTDIKHRSSVDGKLNRQIFLSPKATPFLESGPLTKEALDLSNFLHGRNGRESQDGLNELGIPLSAMHHFSNMIKSMSQAVLSSTPGIVYPPPRLIVRLHEDEEAINSIGAEAWISLRPNNAAIIRTLNGFRARELQRFVETPVRERMSRKSTARTGDTWSTTSDATTNTSIPQSITAYSTLRNPKLALDANLELSYLSLSTNSIQSVFSHQNIAISFSSFCTGKTMIRCEGPTLYVIDFYRYSSGYHPTGDKPLGEVILNWCSGARKSTIDTNEGQSSVRQSKSDFDVDGAGQEKSPKTINGSRSNEDQPNQQRGSGCPKCPKPIQDHIFTFCHGNSRITAVIGLDRTYQVADNESRKESNTSTTDNNNLDIVMWNACKICHEQMKPLPMSLPTYKYSFGKYLELLLYDYDFLPPKTMCKHATKKESILSCFQHKGVIVQFGYEDIELFEMRVPRLQVVIPENDSVEISDKGDQEGGSDTPVYAKEATLELTACEEVLLQTEGEVDSFFAAVARHIKLLQEYLIAEEKLERQSATFFLGSSKSEVLRGELDRLVQIFNDEKTTLLRELDKLVGDEMNDFNRWFSVKVKSILESLHLWQETNCPELDAECVWDPMPDWIKYTTVHLFPGSSIPVREDEPSSIIAHTLSSKDYQEELEQKPIITSSLNSSTSSSAAALFTESPEAKTPRQVSSEDLAKSQPDKMSEKEGSTKKMAEPVHRELLDGFYSTVGRETVSLSTTLANVTAPASLRATLLETIRDMNVSERLGSKMSTLGQLQDVTSERDLQLLNDKLVATSQQNTVLPNGMDDKALKTIEADVAKGAKDVSRKVLDVAPQLPPAVARGMPKRSNSLITEVKVTSIINEPSSSRKTPSKDQGSVKSTSSSHESKGGNHLSPHIKHKYTHNHTQFSCTVYFAREFDELRKRCGIDKLIIQSLSRCEAWSATGGKSKSSFFKTRDNRLVLKEMVSSWNVAERDALLRFAPKYFTYLKTAAGAPSVLAKIFGFYTIKIRKLAEEKTALKMDILVMEHLFYHQNISRRFDLKGIQGRHVEEGKKSAELTLWDADWVEGFRATLMVHAQSKTVIEQALHNDANFLADCNIMDYSLLVGIDDDKKEMIVGIVDFIGTFTWFKKLESTSKSALQPHKEVTVLSPNKYKARFCETILDYFLGIPDKWIRIQETSQATHNRSGKQGTKSWSWWYTEDDKVEEWEGLVPLPYPLV